jgi:integrase
MPELEAPFFQINPSIIGRSMPRERRQNGWVEKTGKQVKKWVGYYYEYVVENGTEKRKPRSKVLGPCKELTKGAAEDRLRDHIRGIRPPASDATFEQLGRWYLKTKSGEWSKSTQSLMSSIFEHQIFPRLGSMVADSIRKSDVQQAMNDIAAQSNSCSESMLKKCLTHIRGVFNLAIEDDLLEKNPAHKAKLPKFKKPSERFLEMEECKRLLKVAALQSTRDYIIVRILLSCGLRPGELFALRDADILPGQLRIDEAFVRGEMGETKTEDSDAPLALPPLLESQIRDYIRENNIKGLLFTTRVGTAIATENYLDRTLKPLGVLAEIDVEEVAGEKTSGLNFQVLRRTCATHFQKHGKVKDVQAHMRHSDVTTTLKHYQKTLDESLIGAVHSLDREFVN